MEGIEGCRGKFVSPFLELGFSPTSVQTDDVVGEVFRKRQTVFTFADQDIAHPAARRAVVYMAAGVALAGEVDDENFAMIFETGPVIPGLAGFKLGVSPAPSGHHDRVCHLVVGGIVIKNPLAGFAEDHMSCGAHFILGLRAQHDLTGEAFVIAGFGKAAAAMLRYAIILAEQVGIHASSGRVPLAIPLG